MDKISTMFLAASLIIIMLGMGLSLVADDFKRIIIYPKAIFVALVLNVATMLIGYYSAKLFKIKDKRAISISIESGIQNGTLAMTIAIVLLGSTQLAITPAIYSLLMFFTGGAAIYFGNKRNKAIVEKEQTAGT